MVRIVQSLTFIVFGFICVFGKDSEISIRMGSNRGNHVQITGFHHYFLELPDSLLKNGRINLAKKEYLITAEKFRLTSEWEGYLWSLNKAAQIMLDGSGKSYMESEEILSEALLVGQKQLGEHHPFLVTTYNLYSRYFFFESEPVKTFEMLNKALIIARNILPGNDLILSDLFYSMGNLHTYLRYDYQQAEMYFNRSLKIRESVLDWNHYKLFLVNYGLAIASRHKGDYEKALSFAFHALKIYRSYSERISDWEQLCYGIIASIYRDKNELNSAVEYFKRAIEFNLKYKSDKNNLAIHLNNLGITYLEMGQLDQAETQFASAINWLGTAESYITGEVRNSLLGISKVMFKRGRHDLAKQKLKEGLDFTLSFYGAKHPETSIFYQELADLYYQLEEFDSTMFFAQKSIISGVPGFDSHNILQNPAIDQIKLGQDLFRSFQLKGRSFRRLQMFEESLNSYLIALHLNEKLIKSYDREFSKLYHGSSLKSLLAEVIDLIYDLNRSEGSVNNAALALDLIDRPKSKILLNELSSSTIRHVSSLSHLEWESERNLKFNLTYLQNELVKEKYRDKPNDNRIEDLYNRMLDVEKDLNDLKDRMRGKYPNYYQAVENLESLNRNEIHQLADITNSIIVEFFWTDQFVYSFGVTADTILFRRQESDIVTRELKIFEDQVKKGININSLSEDYLLFVNSAYALWDLLFNPILYNIGQTPDALIIIPDGRLSKIPFEALLSQSPNVRKVDYGGLNYLIQRFQISYAYSLRFLRSLFDKRILLNNPKVIAFAYDHLADHDQKNSGVSDNNYLRDLPGTGKELEAVSKFFDVDFRSGEMATESYFKEKSNEYDILHLALHGIADSVVGTNSKLIFRSGGQNEDGILHAYELYDVNINARLAVLTACESGLGKYHETEGIYSVARAFMYAGCPSLVMSLWRIEDRATSEVISHFYEDLDAGSNLSKALRQSKIRYIVDNDRLRSHPYYWAGLVLMGDNAPVIPQNTYAWWILLAIVVVMLFGYYAYRGNSIFSRW